MSARRAEVFILQPGDRPIVLLSAGIGATPCLNNAARTRGGTLDTPDYVVARGAW